MTEEIEPSPFYRFREERYWRGSLPNVGFVKSTFVEKFISKDEIAATFGGYLEYEELEGAERFLGVWGDRKIARFLNLLQVRGATLRVEEPKPERFRQRHRSSTGPKPRP